MQFLGSVLLYLQTSKKYYLVCPWLENLQKEGFCEGQLKNKTLNFII